jgi:Spy/CpxP family protein refolding chaperone
MKILPRTAGFSLGVRRWIRPAAAALLLGGIAIGIGAGAVAQNAAGGGWHHGGAHAMMGSSEDAVAHVNGMLQYIYTEVGATEAQKAQLAAIAQQATTDLAPLHDKLHSGHAQVFSLLTQDSIDRTAIETARAAQMSVVDQASRRVTQFVADVAEVLTPAQRKALADHLSQHAS